jgi:hypothetical protein
LLNRGGGGGSDVLLASLRVAKQRNLGGKVLGPAGLALIMGAGDIIKPAAPNLVMLGPAFVYFASWLVLGVIGFWVFGPEPKGRTFEEMDSALYRPAAAARPAVQSAGN